MVRLIGLPPASRRGLSGASKTVEWAPIQSGVGASARKSPFAGDAITAIDSECLRNARRWPPSEKGVGCAKDLACNFRGQETGGMRAHSRLCKTPGGARINRRERLDDLVERDEIDVAATHRDR